MVKVTKSRQLGLKQVYQIQKISEKKGMNHHNVHKPKLLGGLLLHVRTGAPFRSENMPRVGILSWEYSTAGDWILLCPLEDVANHDAQKAHNDQEGDGETAAALAALFP